MDNYLKAQILSLVSNDNVNEAIKLLKTYMEKSGHIGFAEILFIETNFTNLEKLFSQNIISNDEYMLSVNNIKSAIITLVVDSSSKPKISTNKRTSFLNSILEKASIFRPKRLWYIIGISMFCFFFVESEVLNAFLEQIFGIKLESPVISTILLFSLAFIIILFVSILSYLDEKDVHIENMNKNPLPKDFRFDLNNIIKNIVVLDEKNKEKLVEIVRKTLEKDLIQIFHETASSEFKKKSQFENITSDLPQIRSRILAEVKSLNGKANINLSIGVVTTVIAIIFLLIVSFYSSQHSTTWQDFTFGYIPRLTFVVFVEIFSFYFLKLYRTNLNEIQYYQNEITSIEFKIAAFKAALLSDDKENMKYVINELTKIDYNRILKKDETTIEIERNRAENEYSRVVLEKIFDHFNVKSVLTPSTKSSEKTP